MNCLLMSFFYSMCDNYYVSLGRKRLEMKYVGLDGRTRVINGQWSLMEINGDK